jgi:GAF domain-containing protein
VSISSEKELYCDGGPDGKGIAEEILTGLSAKLMVLTDAKFVSFFRFSGFSLDHFHRIDAAGRHGTSTPPEEAVSAARKSISAGAVCTVKTGGTAACALPVAISAETSYAILLEDLDAAALEGGQLVRCLECIAAVIRSFFDEIREARSASVLKDGLVGALSGLMGSSSTKSALLSLGEDFCSKYSVDGIALYASLPDGLFNVWSCGQPVMLSTSGNEIREAILNRCTVRTLFRNGDAEMHCIVIPVLTMQSSYAVVLQRRCGIERYLEEIVRIAYTIAFSMFDKSRLIYSISEDVVELFDRGISAAIEEGLTGARDIISLVMDLFVSGGYFEGYRLFSRDELQAAIEGKLTSVQDAEMLLTPDETAACFEVSSTLGFQFVRGNFSKLAFAFADNSGKGWTVLASVKTPVISEAEALLWHRFHSMFGVLFRTFSFRMDEKSVTSRISELEKSIDSLSTCLTSIGNSRSMRETLTRLNDFMSEMGLLTAVYAEDGERFERIDSGKGDRIVFTKAFAELLISSSRKLHLFIHELENSAFNDNFSHLFEKEVNHTSYLMVMKDSNKTVRGFIIFRDKEDTGIPPARFRQIADVSIAANLKISFLDAVSSIKSGKLAIEGIGDVLDTVSRPENLQAVVEKTAEAAAHMTNSPSAVAVIHDMETDTEAVAGSYGVIRDPSLATRTSAGVSGRVLRNGVPEIVNDYARDRNCSTPHRETYGIERIAVVPVMIDIKHRGHISVFNTFEGNYQPHHLRLLEKLAQIMAFMFRYNGEKEVRTRLLDDFNLLQDAEIALYSCADTHALLDEICARTAQILKASGVLLVSDVNGIKRITNATDASVEMSSVVYDGGIIGRQFDEQPYEAKIVDRVKMEEEWAPKLSISQMLLVRLSSKNNIVVAAYSKTGETRFSTPDISRMNRLSRIASAAMDKLLLVEGLNNQLRHLEIMHLVVDSFVRRKTEVEIISEIIPKVVEICNADVGLLWRHDGRRSKNVVVGEFYRNGKSENLVGTEIDAWKGITGVVFRTKKPMLVADASLDNYAVQLEGTEKQPFETVMATPLVVNGEILGVLVVYRDRQPSFSTSELKSLISLSEDISVVMSRYFGGGKDAAMDA